MPRYILSSEAAEDLEIILQYTRDNWGRTQARKYAEGFEKCFEIISENPQIGPEMENGHGRRRFLHGRHIIYYRVSSDGVRITRIVHSAMNSEP